MSDQPCSILGLGCTVNGTLFPLFLSGVNLEDVLKWLIDLASTPLDQDYVPVEVLFVTAQPLNMSYVTNPSQERRAQHKGFEYTVVSTNSILR